MVRATQDAIETFISITGASEAVALQKLEEHGGDLNAAVNAHFSEGDNINERHAPVSVPPDDELMVIDEPVVEPHEFPRPFPSASSVFNPFSILDPNFPQSLFDRRGSDDFNTRAPFVSHPREVREVPIDFKDGSGQSDHSGQGPRIEDITGESTEYGPDIHGNVVIADDEDEDLPVAPVANTTDNVTDYSNDIEEQMIQAAIEASKMEVEERYSDGPFSNSNHSPGIQINQQPPATGDAYLAHAVSLSLKTAEEEKALREVEGLGGLKDKGPASSSGVEEQGIMTESDKRQGVVSSDKGGPSTINIEAGDIIVHEEDEDVDEQPLVRNRPRRTNSGAIEPSKEAVDMQDDPPSGHISNDISSHSLQNGDAFQSYEWGGLSSIERDEAVMLEAAMFGGIPESSAYHYAYPSHGLDRNAGIYPSVIRPRQPSPTLAAQRLLREQQDDEYHAALQADREKELKAVEEEERRLLEEAAALEAAREKQKLLEEEAHRKLVEEEELERQIAAKQASLPQEPASDDESAVTLLIRMPDGSRRGRRFLKSDKLQSLFDFIDVGRGFKPGTYRLVRPFPRRAFSDVESGLSLSELSLTSKQEALFLELI
ncbi:hypothetical protein QJS10_CPB15g00687 [Acorus calamus]|uniref:UBX domain-containing protein n=1 Tax=Acorus calamus TaxID=4465 RepID=A0AAV9D630_ACOCL|nr:hypothetical protein QJS10_CPB15g00687 [Acorus calamus]